jgi:hypothetical protein
MQDTVIFLTKENLFYIFFISMFEILCDDYF